MARIIDKKEYIIRCLNRSAQYKLYFAKHSDNLFHAGVLYYDETGSWEDNNKKLNFYLESFINYSEKEVLAEAVNWIKSNLDSNAEIEEI
jgi:hypothetical protein